MGMPKDTPPAIVVIDDNPDHLEFVETMLKRSGYAAVGFDKAAVALGYIEHQPVSLIITDIYMPDMDGIELLRCLRQAFPTLPVIAISGSDRSADGFVLKAMQAFGAQAVFTKPLDATVLAATIARLVGTR
jgi:CheY-like chemotaxis protein